METGGDKRARWTGRVGWTLTTSEKLTSQGRLSPRAVEAKLLASLKPEPGRLPAIPAVSMKDLGLSCFLQPFGQNQSSTRMWSVGWLGRRHQPCNEKDLLRSLLKIQILWPHPSGRVGKQAQEDMVELLPQVFWCRQPGTRLCSSNEEPHPSLNLTPNSLTHSVRAEENQIQPLQFIDEETEDRRSGIPRSQSEIGREPRALTAHPGYHQKPEMSCWVVGFHTETDQNKRAKCPVPQLTTPMQSQATTRLQPEAMLINLVAVTRIGSCRPQKLGQSA